MECWRQLKPGWRRESSPRLVMVVARINGPGFVCGSRRSIISIVVDKAPVWDRERDKHNASRGPLLRFWPAQFKSRILPWHAAEISASYARFLAGYFLRFSWISSADAVPNGAKSRGDDSFSSDWSFWMPVGTESQGRDS